MVERQQYEPAIRRAVFHQMEQDDLDNITTRLGRAFRRADDDPDADFYPDNPAPVREPDGVLEAATPDTYIAVDSSIWLN